MYVYHWCYNHVLVNSFFISLLYYITIVVHVYLFSSESRSIMCSTVCCCFYAKCRCNYWIFFSVCSFLFLARQTDAVIITLNQLFTYSEISTCFSSLFFFQQRTPKIVIFLAPLFVFSAESSMSPSKQF